MKLTIVSAILLLTMGPVQAGEKKPKAIKCKSGYEVQYCKGIEKAERGHFCWKQSKKLSKVGKTKICRKPKKVRKVVTIH